MAKMSTKLREAEPGWFFLHVPSALFGTRERVRVKGTLNGHPFGNTSAMPGAEDEHLVAVNKQMREGFGIEPGDTVNVEIEIDDAPPPALDVPPDLEGAMLAKGARSAFDAMAWSHRKRYVEWLAEAKQPETRARRVAQAVAMILAKKDPLAPREKKKQKRAAPSTTKRATKSARKKPVATSTKKTTKTNKKTTKTSTAKSTKKKTAKKR